VQTTAGIIGCGLTPALDGITEGLAQAARRHLALAYEVFGAEPYGEQAQLLITRPRQHNKRDVGEL
jgi:hypothetical protein